MTQPGLKKYKQTAPIMNKVMHSRGPQKSLCLCVAAIAVWIGPRALLRQGLATRKLAEQALHLAAQLPGDQISLTAVWKDGHSVVVDHCKHDALQGLCRGRNWQPLGAVEENSSRIQTYKHPASISNGFGIVKNSMCILALVPTPKAQDRLTMALNVEHGPR